ncbi:hypothetical protein BAUCODRAFT_371035 [Baudoinia panamericana UAMH 10762]|uniref:Prenylcysteine lyase domain-containing protein n=1 Tax=Baudoinia panamericana (strain UAMH 10762) TaxID=717646 RepID=M2MTK8_BAUPA|nr:uncharacterized protein BAUCODRAFT_371035 [Baudoinia panamericana UAMH 10762]EMD00247.1 hypothetical protein BAUCODRAFT_371035 [Baudoinia panamericana UAMH 10762]
MKLSIVLTTALAGCLSPVLAATEQVVLNGEAEARLQPINVAIIGAGAAGSSSAYHLAKFAASAGLLVNVTVFERNGYIGGRSTTVNVYNRSEYAVELGASIFVTVNKVLVDAVNEFNLSTGSMIASLEHIPGAALAVWDGKDFAFVQDRESTTWWDTARMLWKYGLAPVRTVNLMKSTVGKFLKMYDEAYFPWSSLSRVADNLDLMSATSVSGEQYLATNGITGAFGHDVIQASTRVNYAQNLRHINGLVSMVCMATDGAMSVEGGNWQIFDQMIKAAKATTMLETNVTGLKKRQDGLYELTYAPAHDYSEATFPTASFDAVILAAPHQFASLQITQNSSMRQPDPIRYVQLHVTLFTSPHLLSPAYFNMAAGQAAPKVILTTLQPNEQPLEGPAGAGHVGFFSISLLSPVFNPQTGTPEYLYKIFSPSALTSEFMAGILGLDVTKHVRDSDVTWMHRKIWDSYPYEVPRASFEDIQLDDGVWYTGGMEAFISTMETNALMGMNVAKLVIDQWTGKVLHRTGDGSMEEPDMWSHTAAL